MRGLVSLLALIILGVLSYMFYVNSRNNKIYVGSLAPAISLMTADGEMFHSKSLLGKIVILDFWASWCAPCRKANAGLLRVYNKYKNAKFNNADGLVIVMVSLDDKEDYWKAGIAKDSLQNFIHVSDLRTWKNEAAIAYGINSIPANFVINANGYVVNKMMDERELDLTLKKLLE